MKKIALLFIGLLASVGLAQGQFTATYDFASVSTSSGTTDPTTPPSATNLTFGAFTAVGVPANPNAAGRFSFTDWALGATNGSDSFAGSLNAAEYYQVTITVNEGFKLDLNSITFTIQRSGTGIRQYSIRSSLDSYAQNLPASISPSNATLSVVSGNIFQITDVTTTAQNGSTITLGSQFDEITGSVTFRFYGFNAEASGGSFSIDNVTFSGTVSSAAIVVAPTVTTGTSGSITPSTASITGSNVTEDGGANITERGVVYSTTTAPTIANSKVVVAGTTGAFNADLTALASETQYFVRAFATNSAGTSYGSEIDFTTTAATGLIEASVASLSAFSTTYGTASASQNFSASGEGLSGDITVTAPTGFEVSLTSGSGYAVSVMLSPTGGTVASTTIYVRIAAATTPATPSGDVVLSGGGAEAVNVSIPSSTVSAKPLTIADSAVTTKTYNGTNAAVITGSLTGVINDDVVGFIGTGTFDTVDAGEGKAVTSTSSLTGDDAGNYTLNQPVGLTGTITKANQTITFAAIATQSLSAGSLALSATSNSSLTVSYVSSNTAVATVSGTTVTFVGTGTTTITASQAGNTNYNAAISVERELVIESRIVLAQFTFETSVPATSGPHAAEVGSGSASASHASASAAYSNPAGNGSTESFSSNNWAIGDYYQVTTDTRNVGGISIKWDQLRSSTGPATFKLQYSANGTDFIDFATDLVVTTSWSTFNQDLSTVSALNNLETIYFRVVTTSTPGAPTGTNRIDNVTIAASSYAATLTGNAGWRMLSSPASGTTLSDLFGSIWTQGFTGADVTTGGANILFKQGGPANGSLSNFTAATNITNTIPAGHGVLVAVFEDDDYGTPGVQGGFPKSLTVSGVENSGDVAVTTAAWTSGWEYFLAGNPYASTIDWDSVMTKGADVSEVVWVLGNDGEFDAWNGSTGDLSGGLIAPFQGFLYAFNGPASGITFTEESKSTSGGTFRGKEQGVMAVRLALRDGARENSTWLQFAEDGTFARDSKDAVKLAPLSSSVFQLYTKELVTNAAMDIHYLPVITERLELPLALKTSASGQFTLVATEIRLPSGWNITIRDEMTSTSHIVNTDSGYTFESDATPNGEPRFTLVVEPGQTTEIGDQKSEIGFELAQNYPNPFNPSTQIRFSLQSSHVTRLTVYDVLGREVAVLVNETMPVGSHTVNFDASNITSGVYIYKLEAGGQTITKRMTLVK